MATVVSKGSCNLDALKRIVCKFLKKDVEITNPLLEPAVPKGGNFISDAWRLSFFLKSEGITTSDSVIVKAKPANESQNKLMHTEVAFKNEILAYETIIPTLNKYVCSPIRVPQYLHGDLTNIVLEDMSKTGFQTVDKQLAIEWNQVWSPIQEIAKLHASSICMQHLDKAGFESLKNQIIDIPLPESSPLGEKQVHVLDTILGVLKERREDKKYIDLVESLKANAWRDQKEIVQKDVPVRVINHGSLWINNAVFRKDMATLLDLQHIVYSTPANDLSFFMYVNLDPKFFTNNRKDLLRFYLLSLHSNITDRLGIAQSAEVIEPLNYDWIDREFRRCSLYAYMMAQWIMPVFYWSDVVFGQLEAKGGFEKLSVPERMSYLSSEQKDRIVKLTKLFVEESSKN
ncbi:uncharacterized protein LOC123306672 [Coccinella septempunctata]|uniref:uncharacterized protein LOC123306672 n=1 Tax=Coccinella septempunctata TaxID=41139 RepID=UPI001D06C853|nr:uncharacterized protein LOC123306672 [Coccinella septempunctata]